jgi:hypothetical protein
MALLFSFVTVAFSLRFGFGLFVLTIPQTVSKRTTQFAGEITENFRTVHGERRERVWAAALSILRLYKFTRK